MIAVSLPNTFQSTHYRTLRACVFSALGLWGIVPVAHQLICYWDVWAIQMAFKLDLLMGVIYLVSRARATIKPGEPGRPAQDGRQPACLRTLSPPPLTPPTPPHPTPPQGGAAIYASRIPERWMPGKLDLIGHSHQLWHVAVVLAALVHYKAIMVLLQWRDASGGCAANLNAHVPSVLQEIQAGGSQVLEIHQVWQNLSAKLHEFVSEPAAGGLQPPLAA